jgi:hypothetical protein
MAAPELESMRTVLRQRKQRQDETPDNRSLQPSDYNGFKNRRRPKWFAVLVIKMSIRHRNLHWLLEAKVAIGPPRCGRANRRNLLLRIPRREGRRHIPPGPPPLAPLTRSLGPRGELFIKEAAMLGPEHQPRRSLRQPVLVVSSPPLYSI